MARQILTTFDSSGAPILSVDFDFFQTAYTEQFNAIVSNIIFQKYGVISGSIYILYGCVDNISGGNHNISSGAVYCSGEIFQCPSQVFPVVGGTVVVANLSVTYDPADPITYDDLSTHSPHQIRTISFQTGASGSGQFVNQIVGGSGGSITNDLSNFLTLNGITPGWINTPVLSIVASGGGSFTGYTVSYSKYKIDTDGKTFSWTARISGGTIAGTVNFLAVSFSTPLGRTYANGQSEQYNSSWAAFFPTLCLLTASDIEIQLFTYSPNVGYIPFNAGTGDINFSITAELN